MLGQYVVMMANLEHAQVLLGEKINILLQNRNIPIILGGGHETVYGHYLGVRSAVGSTSKIGIVNIDAHFDMRLDNQGASSGTMFYQILNEDRNANYIVIGIQAFGNTKALFERAQAFQVTVCARGTINRATRGNMETANSGVYRQARCCNRDVMYGCCKCKCSTRCKCSVCVRAIPATC